MKGWVKMHIPKCSRIKVLIVLSLILLSTACSTQNDLSASDENAEIPDEVQQTATTVIEAPDEASEMGFLACPSVGESLTLGLDHTLTIEMPEVNLTHILHEGFLLLSAVSIDSNGETILSSAGSVTLPYEMMGTMAECTVEMSGTMFTSASGFCVDGVVYLTILEEWQSASGQMVCDGEMMAFQSPGPGTFAHEGADGNGEVFYLVSEPEGYTIMREFGQGSGYHSWTLYASQIESVPLVPAEP